ncbi:hypothetical protein [Corynebacterium silvaticum]|uniref:Asp23/Gls24 family envelope stress response protein n=1 Tax=Corynebacterium silvaticum TaxID=2320431 RepID=A0A7Y4P8S3_9CORY|nr:hypothetical protein [Corynebacterium silvaticum]ARU45505.1 hypothetical protein CBE74_02195 [Corynebacterium silvaticum]MBH5300085.1 hypothetical protein [Corynebacterium silvaticum]NOM65390.1 hypothetical protein [Corynebacterium silvaticum]NON70547.1 hypothetical protein [Corynebacterium silvaticum]TFA92405.1 hypothetical protein EU802_07045 [Corynebacterium silvaticum]
MTAPPVIITDRALTKLAKAAVHSVPGTVRVPRRAGRSLPRIDVRRDDLHSIPTVEAFVAVTWPSPVTAVAENVAAAISEWFSSYAGIQGVPVNVVVTALNHGARLDVAPEPQPPRVTHPVAPEPQSLVPIVTAPQRALKPITIHRIESRRSHG